MARRSEYVRENVKAATNRLVEAEEALLDAVTPPEQPSGGTGSTEIVEQLDEEGNVVSSSLADPGEAASRIADTLRRGGLTEFAGNSSTGSGDQQPDVKSSALQTDRYQKRPIVQANCPAPSTQSTSDKQGRPPTMKEATKSSSEPSIVPPQADETPKEAQLRREMLEYSMNEVAAVVGEMSIEQVSEGELSEFDGEDLDDQDASLLDEDDDEEDEDGYGRATGRLVAEDYRQQMLELERKLNAKAIFNAGLRVSGTELQTGQVSEGERKRKATKKVAKGVRFAEQLDIQEAPKPQPTPTSRHISERPISTSIVERSFGSKTDATSSVHPPQPRKAGGESSLGVPKGTVQALRSSPANNVADGPLASLSSTSLTIPRQPHSQPVPVPEALQGDQQSPKKTVGDVLERKPQASKRSSLGPNPLDEAVLHQEVAGELNRLRNHKIQQAGGFTSDVDEDEMPLDDKGRKMSRFKAARLSQSAM